MLTFRELIFVSLGLGLATSLVLATSLWALWRRFQDSHLRLWSFAYFATVAVLIVKAASLWLPQDPAALTTLRTIAALASTTLLVLHSLLVVLGVIEKSRGEELPRRAVWRILGVAAACSCVLAVVVGMAAPDSRLPARAITCAVIATASLIVVRRAMFSRARRGPGIGRTVAFVGFLSLVLVQTLYALTFAPIDWNPEWAKYLWLSGFADVPCQAMIAFGLILWHLEEAHESEREALVEIQRGRDALIRSQRLEVVGQLAGELAHDYNNVLTCILGYCGLARRRAQDDATLREAVDSIEAQIDRASAITRSLLAVGRNQAIEPRSISLARELKRSEALLRSLLDPKFALVLRFEAAAPNVLADPSQIDRILLNLVLNARDAMPGGGTISISIERERIERAQAATLDVEPGEFVRWTVSDDGPGLPPEVRARLFEPFVTTKPPGAGSGLGLATVFGCVRQSRGAIEAHSEGAKGTSFVIHLPASDPPASVESPRTSDDSATSAIR